MFFFSGNRKCFINRIHNCLFYFIFFFLYSKASSTALSSGKLLACTERFLLQNIWQSIANSMKTFPTYDEDYIARKKFFKLSKSLEIWFNCVLRSLEGPQVSWRGDINYDSKLNLLTASVNLLKFLSYSSWFLPHIVVLSK